MDMSMELEPPPPPRVPKKSYGLADALIDINIGSLTFESSPRKLKKELLLRLLLKSKFDVPPYEKESCTSGNEVGSEDGGGVVNRG